MLNPADLKSAWQHLSNLNDGTHPLGGGKAKRKAQEFINTGGYKVNQDKKNDTNTP
ncbi:MAG: hypothetical protein ACJAZ3_001181 [Sphingobacteriales bacterium]|jgi:hypothetical protein